MEGNQFLQFVADNVDHNVWTIDGHCTFHGMGIIAKITTEAKSTMVVPKVHVSMKDIAQVEKIHIHHYQHQLLDRDHFMYKDLANIDIEDPTALLNVLCSISLHLHCPCPSWSSIMQMVQKREHPGRSSVHLLPMIDMNTGDLDCIYSTLHFVCAQTEKYNVTPILTFDQPLWWQARTILQQEPADSNIKSVVLRLGGLHIEKFFGSNRSPYGWLWTKRGIGNHVC